MKADLFHNTLHSVWKWANSETISRFTCHRTDALQTDQQPTGKSSWALTDLINGISSQPDSIHTSWATSPVWRVLQRMVTFSTDMKCSTYKPKARDGQRSPGGEVKQRLCLQDAEGHKPWRSLISLLLTDRWILFQNGLSSKTRSPTLISVGFKHEVLELKLLLK